MDRIAEATRPLVRLCEQGVLVDPALIRKAGRCNLAPLTAIDALSAALSRTAEIDGAQVEVAASGWIAELRERIRDPEHASGVVSQPPALQATLRQYQLHGLSWLDRMSSLGLGGCLADDMGKTITLIALHLHRHQDPVTRRPTLVVCPTSLLGNAADGRSAAMTTAIGGSSGPLSRTLWRLSRLRLTAEVDETQSASRQQRRRRPTRLSTDTPPGRGGRGRGRGRGRQDSAPASRRVSRRPCPSGRAGGSRTPG